MLLYERIAQSKHDYIAALAINNEIAFHENLNVVLSEILQAFSL